MKSLLLIDAAPNQADVSVSQVTGSLSDGVGILTVDQRHERVRRQIRSEAVSSSGQLMAGIKGLGHGLMGGITSVVTQTYYGAKDDGIEVQRLRKLRFLRIC